MKALYICDHGDITAVAPECRRLGCGIEVQAFYDPGYAEGTPDAVQIHRDALKQIPSRSLHGPFADLSAGSFDSDIRTLTRHRFEQGTKSAARLDIHRIILHHGYIPGTSAPQGWLHRFTAFWCDFLAWAPAGMTYHMENHLEQDPGLISDVIDVIADPRATVCLDIGHVHCHAAVPIVEWVRHLAGRIGYVHLHDNHGQTDEHLALGDGTIDLESVCAALEEHSPQAIWALEASRDDQVARSVDWLVGHGYDRLVQQNRR